MFIRDLIRYNLYHPEETNVGGGSLTASAIEDALATDDAEPEVKLDDDSSDDEEIIPDNDVKLSDDSDDEESDDDEEKSDDDKDEDDEDKELDLETEDELELAKIPKRAEIKAAYPDIFKKFPALDHIIQREHAFAEVFPTVADAKNAKVEVNDFKQFQDELLSGDITGVLTSVKKANPHAFNKITDGLLDSLMKVDSNSHLGITARVTKGILNHIHTAAGVNLKRDPNNKQAQQLQIASEMIHEAIFNSPEVTPFVAQQNRQQEENPELAKFKAEKEQFNKTRFESAFNSVATSVNSVLTRAVERDIDTKGILPPYVKSRVVADVMKKVDQQLATDTRFKNVIDKLWQRARDNNFNDESLNYIKNALKEKAKTILPATMKAIKGEAIKGLSVRSDKSDSSSKREVSKNRGSGTSQKNFTKSRSESDRLVPRDNERAIDFLMRD